MKSIVDGMVMEGKTVRNALVAVFALVVGAAMPSLAADWTDANNVTYTALKSINGGGSGYIATDFTPAGTDTVKFKYKPSTVSGNECIYCSRYSDGGYMKKQFCGFRISSAFRVDSHDHYKSGNTTYTRQFSCGTTKPLTADTEYTLSADYNNAVVTINGTTQMLTASPASDGMAASRSINFTPGSILVLLASHTSTSADAASAATLTGVGNLATGDLYYFQLWSSEGTLSHNFMPAKRDSDGVIGLYDTVVQKFWPATDGSFTGVELPSVATATWTGAAGNGDFSDSGNWTCYDGDGNAVANAIPKSTTDITLGADVPDTGWTAFDASYAGTINLNGHRLVICGGSWLAFSVTNSSSGAPGELRFTVPENETFEKTAALRISGNLSLVKDGPGTFLWSHDSESALSAAIPVLVTNGVFKIGATTGNLFGASGTVTVKAPGQFDINTTQKYGPTRVRTFYIEGDGPDGSGAIVNSAANTQWGYQLNKIVLTGDATIGGRGFIDIRDSGNGIDCGGYELTVKNTGRLLVETGTHLTNATDIVISGGTLQVCNSCVLGAERIVLENGGTFLNYMTSGTKDYNVPFVVREGAGTISSGKNWYHIYSPVTVESGCTLNLPTDGPWYDGAITNETDATLNISGEFNARSSFVNNGFVNHTADDFRLGGRNETAHPCAVENNGTIKTSGGTFQFKAESSMTGTGTLDLAGGSPSVAGDLSGFTGTLRVSGGTASLSSIGNFGGTLVLANGTVSTSLSGVTCPVVFDLSGKTAPFTIPESWLTLPASKQVAINLRGRTMVWGEKLLSWESAPSLAFSLSEGSTPLVEKADGLYFGDGDIVPVSATWTGAANNGLFFDVANWTCLDENNDPVSAFPAASTAITLGADVPQGSWAVSDLEHQTGTIDLNGHRAVLQSASGNSPAIAITDTSLDTSHPGELHFFIGEGVAYTNTASFGITGNLSLVKDGPGLFVWGGGTLAADIPIIVSGGTFKLGVTTENVFGSSGTITVNGTGQFDINTGSGVSPVRKRTFYIEGEGPDGSGAIYNSATDGLSGNHLEQVYMTGDATIGGTSRIDFRECNGGLDGAGYALTIKGVKVAFVQGGTYASPLTTHLTCGSLMLDGGILEPCSIQLKSGTKKKKLICAVTIADGITIKNGGQFQSWDDSAITPEYANLGSITIAEGGGTITRTKNWFNIAAPITVKTGSTLDCPAEGPWYNGAITNETDATTNIGGDFFAVGGIFRNDGSVVHTAGKFYFGSRDDQTHPCRVENNGVFRTVGGNFYFRSENHAHGAGTFDLAGSTATLAGDFSDFTGTILLSGGTATISSINTFTGTLRLKGGTISTSLAAFTGMVVIDVAAQAGALDVDGKGWFTLPSGKEVLVDVGERELQYGDRLLSWTTAPSNVRFKLLGEHKGVLRKDATGVVYEKPKGIVIIFR